MTGQQIFSSGLLASQFVQLTFTLLMRGITESATHGSSVVDSFMGEARGQPSDLHHSTIELLAQHLKGHLSQIWNSVQLLELYLELGGKPIRRSTLISSICEQEKDLIVLSPQDIAR